MFDYSPICCHQHSLPLRASSLTRIFPCAFVSALASLPSSLLSCVCHCMTLLAIHLWSIIIVRLCSRSTRGQSSLQDFARDLPVVNPHRRTLLAIYPWSIIIAGLCLRSTRGQSLLQDFACDPPLAKYYWKTLCTRFLIIWRSTLGQSSSHDCCLAILQTNLGQPAIAPSVPDRSAIYPSSLTSWLFSVYAEHPPPHQLVEYYWVDGFTIKQIPSSRFYQTDFIKQILSSRFY